MPKANPDRDPFERIWERVATVVGTLRALSEPDASSIRGILEATAEEFSTDEFRIAPQRLAGVALDKVRPVNLAKACANNLDQLVTEKPAIDELPPEKKTRVRRQISNLAGSIPEFKAAMPLPYEVAEKLRLARSTFQLNYA